MPKADPLYLTPLLTARGAGPRQAEGTLSHMRGGGGGSYLGPTAERGGNGMLREPSCQRRSWPLGPASLCGHLALGCSLPELLWYADQDGAFSYLLSYEHHTLLLAAAGRLGPRGPLPFHNPSTRTLPLPTSPPPAPNFSTLHTRRQEGGDAAAQDCQGLAQALSRAPRRGSEGCGPAMWPTPHHHPYPPYHTHPLMHPTNPTNPGPNHKTSGRSYQIVPSAAR